MQSKTLILLVTIFVGSCSIGNTKNIVQEKYNKQYNRMIDDLNTGRKDFHYLKFRKLHTKTKNYKPYTADFLSIKKKVVDATNNQNYKRCVKLADKWLKLNYTSMRAHATKAVCCRKQGLNECADKYKGIANSLLDSIFNSGDGKTPETAYETFYTSEIYFFMDIYGLEGISQSLLDKNGRAYDVMKTKSIESGKEYTIYFDITTQITNKNDKLF